MTQQELVSNYKDQQSHVVGILNAIKAGDAEKELRHVSRFLLTLFKSHSYTDATSKTLIDNVLSAAPTETSLGKVDLPSLTLEGEIYDEA